METIAALKSLHESHKAEWTNGRPARYGAIETEYALMRESCGWIDFSHQGIAILTGEDRKGWLQGQITQDLRSFESGAFTQACVLSPTGQIVADIGLWDLGNEYAMILPEAATAAGIKRLRKMLILEDVKIEELTESHGLISIQGPTASQVLGERIELPRLSAGIVEVHSGTIRLLRHDRCGTGGWDIVFPFDLVSDVVKIIEGIAPVGFDAWNAARVEVGIPVYGEDMNEKTLMMEMGQDFISRTVSLDKGCYTGQEIVERIRSRGHANRTWVGLIAESALEIGSQVSHPNRADAGVVTSAAYSPDYGNIGAAMLRAEIVRDGESVSVIAPSGETNAEIVIMPIRHV